MRAALALAALGAAVLVGSAGSAPTQTAQVTMPAKLFAPRDLEVLARDDGHLAKRRHDDAHGHRGRRRVRLGVRTSGRDVHADVHGAGRVRLRLLDPPLHAGIRARVPGRAERARGACSRWEKGLAGRPCARRHHRGRARAGRRPGRATVVARATPGADGVFSFTVRAPEPRGYRVRAGSASSPVVRVRVTPHVAIARRGAAIVVAARPSRAGQPGRAPGLRPGEVRLRHGRSWAVGGVVSVCDPLTSPSGRRTSVPWFAAARAGATASAVRSLVRALTSSFPACPN